MIHSRMEHYDVARDMLLRSSKLDPCNLQVLFELSFVLIHYFIHGAFKSTKKKLEGWSGSQYLLDSLHCLQAAVKLIEAKGEKVPFEISNNMGVLYHLHSKDYSQALLMYEKVVNLPNPCITTLYNLARLYEDFDKKQEAKSIYHHIIEFAPHYSDGIYDLM